MSRLIKVLVFGAIGGIGILLIVMGLTVLTPQPHRVNEVRPVHRHINYPANAQPIAIQCGDQPCVIFYDPDLEAAIALMLDGSTITIKPEVEEPND